MPSAPVRNGVSEDTQSGSEPGEKVPERPGGPANFFRAINVERNAKVGFGIGILLALLLLFRRVLNPGVADYSVVLYAGLAFVLATGVGPQLTVVFTAGSLVRKARDLD